MQMYTATKQTSKTALNQIKKCLPLVTLVIFTFMPSVSRAIFSTWVCVPYDRGPDSTVSFMLSDPGVEVCKMPHLHPLCGGRICTTFVNVDLPRMLGVRTSQLGAFQCAEG